MSNEFPSHLKPKKRTAAGIPPTAVLRVFVFLTAAATAAAVAAAAAHSTEGAAAEAAAAERAAPKGAASAGATEGPAAKAAAHGRTGRTPVVVPGRAGPVIAGAGAIARAVSGAEAGARRGRRAGTVPTGRTCHVAPCEGAPVPACCVADGCNEHPEHEQYDDQHHHQGHEQDHDAQNDILKGGGAVVRLRVAAVVVAAIVQIYPHKHLQWCRPHCWHR